jgi:hypothetical protein
MEDEGEREGGEAEKENKGGEEGWKEEDGLMNREGKEGELWEGRHSTVEPLERMIWESCVRYSEVICFQRLTIIYRGSLGGGRGGI